MSYHPPTLDQLNHKLQRRTDVKACAESLLMERRAAGVEELDHADSIRFRSMMADVEALNDEIEQYRADLERSQIPEKYQNLGGKLSAPPPGSGRVNCRPGSEVMPLHFGMEQLKAAHDKVLRQEPVLLEARGPFNTATPHMPAQLFPVPTFPQHPDRIADRLPAFALGAPSLEYIQVNSVTGAADVVAEGALKPEIVLNTTKLIATAAKIAAHLALSHESLQDWDAFTSSATTELQRLVIDEENAQILGWLNTAGILTHTAIVPTPPATTFDDIEIGISKLRTGPSLATADLLIMNPASWSAIRRQKDADGRYLVAPDPTSSEANTAWGVPVVATTACPSGEGWLLDTKMFGRLAVHETLTVRMGYANDDFVRNLVRYVCEERAVLCVERPSAVLHFTTLPFTEDDDTRSSKTSKSSSSK